MSRARVGHRRLPEWQRVKQRCWFCGNGFAVYGFARAYLCACVCLKRVRVLWNVYVYVHIEEGETIAHRTVHLGFLFFETPTPPSIGFVALSGSPIIELLGLCAPPANTEVFQFCHRNPSTLLRAPCSLWLSLPISCPPTRRVINLFTLVGIDWTPHTRKTHTNERRDRLIDRPRHTACYLKNC